MSVITAGTIFVVTSGEYTGYALDGVFRALQDFDPDRALTGYTVLKGDYDSDQFLAHLVELKTIEVLSVKSLHFGSTRSVEDYILIWEPD